MLGMLWNEGEAAHWETPADFPANPSLFTYLHSGQSLLTGRPLPFQKLTDPSTPGASPAIITAEMPQAPL